MADCCLLAPIPPLTRCLLPVSAAAKFLLVKTPPAANPAAVATAAALVYASSDTGPLVALLTFASPEAILSIRSFRVAASRSSTGSFSFDTASVVALLTSESSNASSNASSDASSDGTPPIRAFELSSLLGSSSDVIALDEVSSVTMSSSVVSEPPV